MQFQPTTADSVSCAKRAAWRAPLALLLVSLSLITALWVWLGTPVVLDVAPIDSARKVDCVSYAPFRKGQTPWNSTAVISPEQISEDLVQLAGISKCVRIYSIENGLDKVPELAAKVGLKVILGVWIGRDHDKNAALIEQAAALVKQNRASISSVIIGSEVLLRGEMTAATLRETIRFAKTQIDLPISYADVIEFWLRDREIADDLDFVTVHVLPFWEDVPILAEDAAEHVDDVRKEMARTFPGKEILIGEAGWPSEGRMRDHSLPSRINQARFFSQLLTLSRREGFRVNLFEAYDEPWKRQWEGTVGAHWGLLDGITRELKYSTGAAVSNFPDWKLQLAAGLVLCLAVFAVAWLTNAATGGIAPWIAVALCAVSGGSLVGMAIEKVLDESYAFAGWLFQGALLATGILLPLICARAIIARQPLPTLAELAGSSDSRARSWLTLVFGAIFVIAIMAAANMALGLVFDPRSRDFPFASLTMVAVPIWAVMRFTPRRPDIPRLAEGLFACLFAASAVFVFLNEGIRNWQSMWTSAAFLLLAISLSSPRMLAWGFGVVPPSMLDRVFGK